MHKNGYFECHIEVYLNNKQLDEVSNYKFKNKVVISKNNKKKSIDGSVVMITLRNYKCYLEEFQEEVKNLVKEIQSLDVNIVEKPLIEFSLYDTNISHDKQWINNE